MIIKLSLSLGHKNISTQYKKAELSLTPPPPSLDTFSIVSLGWKKAWEFSGKCQTLVAIASLNWQILQALLASARPKVKHKCKMKVEIWWAKKCCFLEFFFLILQVPDQTPVASLKCHMIFAFLAIARLKSSIYARWKWSFGWKKVWFFGIFNQFYKCKTKLQKKNQCYLILILVFFLEPQVKQLIQSSRHFLPNSLFTSHTKRPGSVT